MSHARPIALRPDRISTYAYTHVPDRFKAQRQIRTADLPDSETKLGLLNLSIERLPATSSSAWITKPALRRLG